MAEVCEVLWEIAHNREASPAARATAARTLLEHLSNKPSHSGGEPIAEMSEEALDAEIERLQHVK